MKGLLTKRALQTSRTWLTLLSLSLVPILMAVFCGLVNQLITSFDDADEVRQSYVY